MLKWKPIMIGKIRKIWESEYKDKGGYGTILPVESEEREPDFLDDYLRTPQLPADGDCFDSFINSPVTQLSKDEDVCEWWNKPCNPWKELRQQAFDTLSIPAMSAEIERVFSDTKWPISFDRNRLQDSTIEYLELLRYWWSRNIVTQNR
jgi:hypothetical protein